MKLNFLFFIAAESSEEVSPVDNSWKNSEAFKLPEEISFRTERADLIICGRSRDHKLLKLHKLCSITYVSFVIVR